VQALNLGLDWGPAEVLQAARGWPDIGQMLAPRQCSQAVRRWAHLEPKTSPLPACMHSFLWKAQSGAELSRGTPQLQAWRLQQRFARAVSDSYVSWRLKGWQQNVPSHAQMDC
jgi:hypothetical protein